MGITYSQSRLHWNYFIAIERDFEIITRYIEPTEQNNEVYSIELARIIMTATQEVDCVLKVICELLQNGSNPRNINEYRAIVKSYLPNLIQEVVYLPKYGMHSQPWINWNEDDNNPLWWKANNSIKHDRLNYFNNATLKNAYNSVGGLLICVNYLYKLQKEQSIGSSQSWTEITSTLQPFSSLFQMEEDYYHRPGQWTTNEW